MKITLPVLLPLLGFVLASTAGAQTTEPRVWIQDDKLLALDGEQLDTFGSSISISGNTAAIGAPANDEMGNAAGAVYLFERAGTAWTFHSKLTASDAEPLDLFGNAVSLDGDTLLVGAQQENIYSGAAYVFTRSASTWTERAKLVASDSAHHDTFGCGVALDDDTAVIGAWHKMNRGAAYVFVGSGSTWTEQAKLESNDLAMNDWFGYRVALEGDTALISALFDDHQAVDAGSVYAFERTGTAWTQQAKLINSKPRVGDWFGCSLALSGDRALIGARKKPWLGAYDVGAAFVFTRSGASWMEEAWIKPDDVVAGDYFSHSVSLDGDLALVGATGQDQHRGSAYLYARNGTSWWLVSRLTASDGESDDHFGMELDLHRDVALIGASGANGVTWDTGCAYAFSNRPVSAPFCFGDGSGEACPCQNPGGTKEGCANSTGSGAVLSVVGYPVIGADTARLIAAQCPANTVGMFFSSDTTITGFGAGDGLRCIGGSITRLGLVQTGASGVATSNGALSLIEGLQGGELRHYQFWFRDLSGPCGGGSNFTNARSIQW